MKSLSGDHMRRATGRAYIRDVSQLDLQLGLGRLGLWSHSHGDDLGVHHGVIPGRRKSENGLNFYWFNDLITDKWCNIDFFPLEPGLAIEFRVFI